MMYRGDYLLVKAGLDADRCHWFDMLLPKEPADQRQRPEEGDIPPMRTGEEEKHRTGLERIICLLDGGRGQKRERRRQEEAAERCREQYREQLALLEKAVEQAALRLKQAIDEVDESFAIYSVYESELAFLTGEEEIAGFWNRYWGMPEFREYGSPRWAAPLIKEAVGQRFILLGTAEAVPEVLKQCARRMKSLRWILPAEECGGEALDIAEEFCEEYGLAVNPEPWKGGRVCLRFSGEEPPVCVLDFAGEGALYGGTLPEGSVWIDFCSAEEKERRFRRLAPDLCYVSLKKYWRECRRSKRTPVVVPASDKVELVPRFHKYSAFLDSR